MSLPPHIGRVFAATFVMCLLVAGCQSNPEPAPLPSPTPSPTPSSSPSPTVAAPTLPPEARGTSTASAKAFVRHYVALVNHAVASGNSDELARASASDCRSCAAVIMKLNSVYEAGGNIRSDGWKIRSLNVVPGRPTNKPALDVGLHLSPQVVIEKKGAKKRSFEGGRLPATFYLVVSHGTWVVREWERSA